MAEKERRQGAARNTEVPHIGEKVQPKGPPTGSLTPLVRTLMDGMGISYPDAEAAVRHGWDREKVEKIKRHVERWNRILGTQVECVFQVHKSGATGEESEAGSVPGIRDGKLIFTEAFADEVLRAPNIIIGHECGHELERQLNPEAEESTTGLKSIEAHVNPGFDDPRKQHSCPPFGTTSHHNRDLMGVFDRRYTVFDSSAGRVGRNHLQDIGYNARQIYSDSVPVKECMLREGTPAAADMPTMETLMGEWVTLLGEEHAHLSKMIRQKGAKVDSIEYVPALARFTASAWALRRVAAAWIKDPKSGGDIQDKLEKFSGEFSALMMEPDNTSLKGLSKEQTQAFLETPSAEYAGPIPRGGRKSGLTDEQLLAMAVLTRAYCQHFINCLSRKELFEGEDLRPHIEKLNSEDDDMSRREAYTLGEIGSIRALDPLLALYGHDDPYLRDVAIDSIRRIIDENKGDTELAREENLNLIVAFGTNNMGPIINDDMPSKVVGCLFSIGGRGKSKVQEFVDQLIRMLDDPTTEVQDGEAIDHSGDTPDFVTYPVRTNAHLALGNVGKPAIPALTKVLLGDDSVEKYRCAISLGLMGAQAEEAIPLLEKVVRDDEKEFEGVKSAYPAGMSHLGFHGHWALGRIYGQLGNKEKQYVHWKAVKDNFLNFYMGNQLNIMAEISFVQKYESEQKKK